MERIWTSELGQHAGERVLLAGWLHRLRQLKDVSFLVLRDAKGLAQIVVEDTALAERLAQLPLESVLEIEGLAVAEPQAPSGVEIHQPAIDVLAAAAESPPLDLYRPTLKAQLPTILDHAPIALRHPRQRALFRPASLSVTEPTAVQTDHGRRIRARLRGRPGVSGRAARHAAPHQRIRLTG